MIGDYRPWFPRDHPSPSKYYLGASPDSAKQNMSSTLMFPGSGLVSPIGTTNVHSLPQDPLMQVGQVNESSTSFHCLPCSRQGFLPFNTTLLKEQILTAPHSDRNGTISPNEKRFLIFDQSGDQTTLIFSSGITKPAKLLTSWNASAKPEITCNFDKDCPKAKQDVDILSRHPSAIEYGGNGVQNSEMHEDTVELNALLYSNTEDASSNAEDNEVASTGHSPSTATTDDKQDWFEGSKEDVASSDGSIKKRKLAHIDTNSSTKVIRNPHYEDDAESMRYSGSSATASERRRKKSRIEKVRKTISILRNIIPCARGKDAIVVLDEAIQYLKSLKVKAKALGLNDE